jgi:hypothetical protein
MRLSHLFNEGSNWHTDPEQQSMDATRRARLGREREPAGSDTIDARLAANNNARQEYAETGRFWLKQKDTQQHLNDQPYIGKAAANVAALELLKQQPELRGNLVITAYGPGEQQVTEGKVKELGQDLKDKAMSDDEFKKKYSKTRAEVRAAMREKPLSEGSQLDEGAIETITALVKKIPGIGKYYQMAQQYKPQLIEILKTSKSGKEVKQKMEQLAAGQSATVAESGMTKQLGGLAVGGGSILSTMWMNAMGMIDGVLAHAAAGEVGGAVASGSILGLIPVTLMLFAAMLMFKGSKQSSDEKAQAFQAQRGQQGVAEAPGAETLGHNQSTVASNLNSLDLGEGSDDTVGFSLDSERAYQAVMSRFGDMIDQDEDSGTMYAPERLWPKIEQVAYDADGIGAQRDDDLENPEHYGMKEGEKVGNMDADAFDAAMARLKKLAGAGPMRTVYDPAKRVYKNVPTAQQPKK